MKAIAACLIGVIALVFGLWPQAQQDDPKTEIKKKHRDVRYGGKQDSISNMSDGAIGVSWVHLIEPAEDIAETPEGKIAVQNRLVAEHKAKRKAVACESTVILFGKIKNPKGYVTADDTAIYTVYKFAVSQVYRASQYLGLNVGSEIEVTAPGGMAKTKTGKNVGVEDTNYQWLFPTDYILCLKYDQEADDYYVFDPVGVYKITPDGRAVRADSKHHYFARKAFQAKEPNTVDAVSSELKSITCPQ